MPQVINLCLRVLRGGFFLISYISTVFSCSFTELNLALPQMPLCFFAPTPQNINISFIYLLAAKF